MYICSPVHNIIIGGCLSVNMGGFRKVNYKDMVYSYNARYHNIITGYRVYDYSHVNDLFKSESTF